MTEPQQFRLILKWTIKYRNPGKFKLPGFLNAPLRQATHRTYTSWCPAWHTGLPRFKSPGLGSPFYKLIPADVADFRRMMIGVDNLPQSNPPNIKRLSTLFRNNKFFSSVVGVSPNLYILMPGIACRVTEIQVLRTWDSVAKEYSWLTLNTIRGPKYLIPDSKSL